MSEGITLAFQMPLRHKSKVKGFSLDQLTINLSSYHKGIVVLLYQNSAHEEKKEASMAFYQVPKKFHEGCPCHDNYPVS